MSIQESERYTPSYHSKLSGIVVRTTSDCREQFSGPITASFLQDVIKNMWPVDFLAQHSGLYFLYNSSELIYIGKSLCVVARVAQHLSDRSRPKPFNRALYVPISEDILSEAEAEAIRIFDPSLNKMHRYHDRYKAARRQN